MAYLKTLNLNDSERIEVSSLNESVSQEIYGQENFLLLDDDYWKTVRPIENLPIRICAPIRAFNINRFGGWRLGDYKNCSVATCCSESELSTQIPVPPTIPTVSNVRWSKEDDKKMFSVLTQL